MKALIFIVLAFAITSAFAGSGYPVQPTPTAPGIYTCSQYTRNQVFDDQSTTDRPVANALTTVQQTKLGFNIKAGEVFSEEKDLTNSQLSAASVMAGDPETLLLRKEDDTGYPYFIIYQFDKIKIAPDGTPTKGAIIGMVVLGNCTFTQ